MHMLFSGHSPINISRVMDVSRALITHVMNVRGFMWKEIEDMCVFEKNERKRFDHIARNPYTAMDL